MIPIVSVYGDVSFRINNDQNGDLTYAKFNGASRMAEDSLLDYLSGDIENQQPPIPYLSQKNRDWLAPLIVPASFQVNDGIIIRPADYYGFENMFRIGSKVDVDCDDEEDEEDNCNTTIELLSAKEFDNRCTSHIEGLRPSMTAPIAKEIGRRFYFAPKTLGSMTLEYIRYPKYGMIATKTDTVYNEQIPDDAGTINYEWDENVRKILVYLIVDEFSNHTRENALKQMNQVTGKLIRDQK